MTRAEEAALKAYPIVGAWVGNQYGEWDYDINEPKRTAFQNGYEQAEKDLTLTWEDMAKIDAIIMDVNNEFAIDISKEISRQKFYETVLKRFNELKK